jgi:hypothetical protein
MHEFREYSTKYVHEYRESGTKLVLCNKEPLREWKPKTFIIATVDARDEPLSYADAIEMKEQGVFDEIREHQNQDQEDPA